jgi:hypothetical protein
MTMRGLVWLLVLEATLTGCVVETDLARRDLPDAVNGCESSPCWSESGTCATDAAGGDAREDASPGMDGMVDMGGSMECDGHDCDAAMPDSGSESPDGAMP